MKKIYLLCCALCFTAMLQAQQNPQYFLLHLHLADAYKSESAWTPEVQQTLGRHGNDGTQ